MLKHPRFVEFETSSDLKAAVEKLDGQEFKGTSVQCVADVCRDAGNQSPPLTAI